ncbi:MAG TPA: PAS domain S-box protein, partial [Dehalococcoidia bacterium]|nr:PAS domain S-box protein [Dehalococcoidia bacterium]
MLGLPPFFLASVRGRIVFGFALLVLILVAVVAGATWLAREHRVKLARMQDVATTMSLLEDAKGSGTTSFALLQLYLASGDESLVPEFQASRDAAIKAAAEATTKENAIGHDPEVASLSQLAAVGASLTESWEQTIAFRRAGDVPGAAALMTSTLPAATGIGEALDNVTEVERQELSAMRSEADTTGRLAFWLLVISGAIGATLALSVSILIARSILRPLAALESAARAVAGGDLNARARPGGPRELARLGTTLNRMTEALLDASKRRELEAALRRSEQQFRSLIENALDIIMGIGSDGALRYVSPSVQQILGHRPQELVGKNPSELVHPDDLPAVMAAVAQNLRSLEPGPRLEARLRHRDGSWRAVEGIGRSFLDESGTVGIVVSLRDITARKQAEEAIREAEERWRSLVENAPDLIMTVDREGTIQFMNHAVPGFTVGDAIGTTVYSYVRPEYHGAMRTAFVRLFETGEPQSYEVAGDGPSGSTSWYTSRLGPITRDGEVVAATIIASDITARKEAEEALRESDERLRVLITGAPVILYATDSEAVITLTVGAATDGLPFKPEEIVGRPVSTVFAHVPQIQEGTRRALAGEEVAFTVELGELHLDCRISPVWREDGEVAGLVGVATDVTERKRAEEALRRLNQELEKEHKEIAALNRALEGKVKERTRELRIANKELRERNRQLLDARAQAVTDSNTGLPNHRAFHERVRDEIARAHVDGAEIGLIMMDIDAFKSVNDSLGHLAGDRILRGLARTLGRTASRGNAYRYGGDEFAVLLPAAGRHETIALAEKLRRAVETRTNGNGTVVTISLGVACYPDTASSAEELVYGSDAAMYWAKSAGKNRVGNWSELVRHRAEGVLPWYAADRAIRAPDTVAALVAALAAKDPATSAHTERCSWYSARLAEELG